MQEFQDRVAVITGAASGIGRALADRFAAEGMRLVLADVEGPALDAAVTALRAGGTSVVGVVADVSVLEEVQAVADAAMAEFGAVHIVCNNAGVGGGGAVGEAPLAVWRWVLGVNLWGVIHGCHVFVPLLRRQDEGHIVNTASLAGMGGVAGMGAYCTSKFGVVGLSSTLHHELVDSGSGVRVSVLCPGFVNTRIAESERNLPDGVTIRAATPESDAGRELIRGLVAAGIAPSEVADRVLEAVRDERFWIFPHPAEARAIAQANLGWMGESL